MDAYGALVPILEAPATDTRPAEWDQAFASAEPAVPSQSIYERLGIVQPSFSRDGARFGDGARERARVELRNRPPASRRAPGARQSLSQEAARAYWVTSVGAPICPSSAGSCGEER